MIKLWKSVCEAQITTTIQILLIHILSKLLKQKYKLEIALFFPKELPSYTIGNNFKINLIIP